MARIIWSDAAARIGSDAFGVVLPATRAALAVPLAGRILAAVRAGPVETGSGMARDLKVLDDVGSQHWALYTFVQDKELVNLQALAGL